MGTVNVTLGEDTRLNLILGQQDENEVREVVFDFSGWYTTYGSGTISLSVQRSKDQWPYEVELTVDNTNHTATWTITDTDTGYAGVGMIQITYTVGTAKKKSVVYRFTVYKSLGATGNVITPVQLQTWMDEVDQDIADIKQDLAELEGGAKWNNATVSQFIAILREALYASDMSSSITALETALMSDEPIAVTGVTLDQSTVSGFVADTVTLVATVLPQSADDKQVTWSSSDDSVATVNNGVVTFVGAGSATITVTTHDGGYAASCSVTVSAYPTISYFIGANMTIGSNRPGKIWAHDYYNIRATAFLTEQYQNAPEYEIDSTLTSKGFPVPAYGLFIPNGATKVTVSCSGLCCAIAPYAVEDGYATLIDNGHWSEVGGETNYDLSTFISQGANCISLGFKNSSNSSLADTTIDSTTVQVSFS